jgi:hypothetical protein
MRQINEKATKINMIFVAFVGPVGLEPTTRRL